MLTLTRPRLVTGAIPAALVTALAVGCSRQDPATPATSAAGGGGVTTLAIQAGATTRPDGSLYFRQRTLRAPAGQVSIQFTNPASLEHNVAVRGKGKRLGITSTIANGASAELTLTLPRGRYVFFCAVPGHEATGMRGALIVS